MCGPVDEREFTYISLYCILKRAPSLAWVVVVEMFRFNQRVISHTGLNNLYTKERKKRVKYYRC